MKRKSLDLRYIEDAQQRQAVYVKRKASLMRKAMEMAVLCNAQIAMVMFDDKGRLTQFSTSEMDELLEKYGAAVVEPHERYQPSDLLFGSVYANGFGGVGPMVQAAALRAAQGGAGPSSSPGESPSGLSEGCQAAIGTQQLLAPLGLSVDAGAFPPVSPKSEQAYSAIEGEFEKMMQQHVRQQMTQQQAALAAQQEARASMPPPAARKPQTPDAEAAAAGAEAAAAALTEAAAYLDAAGTVAAAAAAPEGATAAGTADEQGLADAGASPAEFGAGFDEVAAAAVAGAVAAAVDEAAAEAMEVEGAQGADALQLEAGAGAEAAAEPRAATRVSGRTAAGAKRARGRASDSDPVGTS